MSSILVPGYEHEHPDTLALYCSDGRFTRSVEELCRARGADRIDTITIPGGPGLLDLGKLSLLDRGAVVRALGFLVAGHQIVRVVLVAHTGCGYYRARYPQKSAAEIEKMQCNDLRSASRYVQKEFRVVVECYFAHVKLDQIQFDPVYENTY